MEEKDFWLELRTKISKIKIESENNWVETDVYCDWIESRKYILSKPLGRIKGRIGFLGMAKQ